MSCGPDSPRFRLLDALVGWDSGADPEQRRGLDGLDDLAGLHLTRSPAGALAEAELMPYLPPPRLARGCGRCDWYLLTSGPARLLRRGRCAPGWTPLWEPACDPRLLRAPVALAAAGHRLAVADPGAGRVWLWNREGALLQAAIGLADAAALTLAPWGELLVLAAHGERVLRFGPDGYERGVLAALPQGAGAPQRIAVAADCSAWVVTQAAGGALKLWRAAHGATEFAAATVVALRASFPRTGVAAAGAAGFCLDDSAGDAPPHRSCYSWYGRPLAEGAVGQPAPPRYVARGQLLSGPIDSGKPGCRWHRVRIDADLPQATTLALAVATADSPGTAPQAAPGGDPDWQDFPTGAPHPLDWQEVPGGVLDFLVERPPGRYLFLRLRLAGDGSATPLVRRIRLDFPRSTSLEFLPPVYRDSPQAEDFSERFLALFDAAIGELDEAIERFPALLDSAHVPDQVLPWLGGFLDLAFDPAWEAARRRAILAALPRLYPLRGTVAGLRMAIRLVFDVDPAIEEVAGERMWGALGRGTVLRAVRLFGKSRARLRLGNSPLGAAPLRSYGDPDGDPLAAGAYRFRVLVPAASLGDGIGLERLRRLVDSQKPAHTLATVRQGGSGFVVGTWSGVGIDTAFAPLPAPVLGGGGRAAAPGTVRLNRMSVLRAGRRGPHAQSVAGGTVVVGSQVVS